jgi:hypothetical protein
MRSRARAVAVVLLLTTSLAGLLAGRGAVHAQPADDEQALADRYAPIVMLRTQAEPCDADGEPFVPMAVDRILDNRQVALRQVGNGDPTVMRGPGAADLADLGEGFYLDFPGDALDPGCLYEQDNDRFNAGQPEVVYAHIAKEDGHPDQLALQYWLYWYYNDWNNKHESDWEFVQLLFPAGSVAEALATDPAGVGYAQHEGGERAGWHDEKLRREGTHPVVYSSQRSHASYYAPALYMGRSGSEGFGCDDTEAPSTRTAPEVVVLPDHAPSPSDPLAWIDFEGRWGERHGGPNNGPTGPNAKAQWTAPVTWQEGLRDGSFVVPGGDSGAAQVIDAFCSVVGWGSVKYIAFVASPARVLLALAVLLALVVFLVRRTSWRVVDATPLRRRRRAGEIWRLGVTEYRRHPGVFGVVGAIAVPIAGLAALIGIVLTHLPLIGRFLEVADPDAASTRLVSSSIIGGALVALPFVVVSALVAMAVDDEGGARLSLGLAWRAVRERARRLLAAFLVAVVVIVLVSLTVVGVPLATWLFVRWQFMPQAAVLEGLGGRAALRRSGALTRRRWWHTALVTGVTLLVVSALGIVVGLVLLVLFTGLPLWALSAVVAVCNILVMPFGALVMTYLYGDAVSEGRQRAAPAAAAEAETVPV